MLGLSFVALRLPGLGACGRSIIQMPHAVRHATISLQYRASWQSDRARSRCDSPALQ